VTVPVHVVPLCIDESRYHPKLTAAFYHGEAKFRFFAMGWWQLRKRWDILLHAFADEFGGNKDVGLVIKTLSVEPEEAVLDQVLSHLGRAYAEQVAVIAGPLPWWELAMIMRSMQAFVLPTSGEGWGCPPMQALALGMPVIITDCMGPGETLRDDSGDAFPGVKFLPAEKEVTKVTHPYYAGRNWWVVDEGDLRRAMREVHENYGWWQMQAQIGSQKVRLDRGSKACARRVREELSRVHREVML
jgi:glycosyltransferase involved in cell wall biosynthesis